MRTVTHRILERQGYTILEANTGAEALAVMKARPGEVHLVLTDMVMPGMSGPELALQLRQRYADLRILFMSGYSRDAALQLTRFPSGTAYLEKPFTPAGLATRVRTLLDEPLGEAS